MQVQMWEEGSECDSFEESRSLKEKLDDLRKRFSLEKVREKLIKEVKCHKSWSLQAAQNMRLSKIAERRVSRYKLISTVERRFISPKQSEPYNSKKNCCNSRTHRIFMDSFTSKEEFDEFEPPDAMKPHPETGILYAAELAGTSSIEDCPKCKQNINCSACLGRGQKKCLRCDGRGFVSKSIQTSRVNYNEFCQACKNGWRPCPDCARRRPNKSLFTRKRCKGCSGSGRVRTFAQFEIWRDQHECWSFLDGDEKVLPASGSPGVNLLVDSSSSSLVPLDGNLLVGSIGQEAANRLSNVSAELLGRYNTLLKGKQVARQEQTVSILLCFVVSFDYKGKSGLLIDYGDNETIQIEGYPFKSWRAKPKWLKNFRDLNQFMTDWSKRNAVTIPSFLRRAEQPEVSDRPDERATT